MVDVHSPEEPTSEAAHGDTGAKEPVITGTLFLNTLILIMIFGFWLMMYFTLLER